MSTRLAEQIADAILYEGYVLYPYRASAPKNQLRWQVGLITPRTFSEATGADPWSMQTECLAECDRGAVLTVRARCLHVQQRTIEQPAGDGVSAWRAVDRLLVGDRRFVSWDESVPCEFVRAGIALEAAAASEWCWQLDGAEAIEMIRDEAGVDVARIVRRRQPLSAVVRVATERCGTYMKLRVTVENVTPAAALTLAERESVVRQSLAGTHAILSIENGAFVSLLDPPAAASALAASCVNRHTFPVLAGAAGSRAVMLSSPIILYDYPAVAPESQGDLFDATEIDELLTLRVRTLTDAEKQEARATDPRAAEIVDRCEAAQPEVLGRLHGAVRSFESYLNPPDEPSPECATVDIAGTRIGRGSPVRLQPARVADSLDICLRGRTGTVTAVYRTLDGQPYVAVTLADDPFGVEGVKYRRSLFFHPEELVPIGRRTAGRALIAGIGNVFLGDDGFGVEVATRLSREHLPEGIRVLDAGIRARDLAYELADGQYDTAVLVDAVARGGAPGTVYVIEPELPDRNSVSTADGHAMTPDGTLAFVQALGGTSTRIVLVGCEPMCVSEGIGLSHPVAAAIDEALGVIRDLVCA